MIQERNGDLWDHLLQSDKKIVLWGMGNGADKIINELSRRSLSVTAVFASNGFARKSLSLNACFDVGLCEGAMGKRRCDRAVGVWLFAPRRA